ncbi:cell wall elongation regulator TseB-like domain-containing protein [Enterococcus durans]|uniref:cell wall elongation regulator TseB-like domain-containing protein n=1 Tax=Enterococcus durans TaxID=53345 RepID=UPI0035E45601
MNDSEQKKERRSLKKSPKKNKKKKTAKEKIINRVLLGLIIFLLAVIVFSSIFYLRSSRPMMQAKKEATEIAEKYADLKEVDRFYWFTRKKTYFSLTGKNDKGQEIVVVIPKSGEKVKVLAQKDGLTEKEAKQKIADAYPDIQVEKATLGMYDDQVVWEITGENSHNELNYYLIAFDTGKEVKTITDI